MSFLFSKPSAPAPQPVPQSPMASPAAAPDAGGNTAAEKQRQDAETAAIAESKASGRRSTIVAGMKIADDEQQSVGLMSQKKRAASKALVG